MIPKIIHYCWFGENPLPENVLNCIESWKKFCPEYEIKQWDESNYDFNKFAYTKEAYENKKYAFVSDVARLDIIYNYGGIYLDTDVELIKPLDELLYLDAFMGNESGNNRIATGLGFGAIKKHPFIKLNLDQYKNRHFIEFGKQNLTTCVSITKETLNSLFGEIKVDKDIITKIMDDGLNSITLLPTDILCPFNLETNKLTITPRTISIHHYDATWKSKKDRFLRLKIKIRRLLGDSVYERLKKIK